MDGVMVITWLAAALAAGIIEACTTALVSVWIVIGAVCAAAAAALGASVLAQLLIFLAVSAVLLLLTLPMCKKFRSSKKTATNADMLIGRTGIITEDVDPLLGTGEAKVGGKLWSVQIRGDGKAKVGDIIKIEEIVGAHLVASVISDKEREDN